MKDNDLEFVFLHIHKTGGKSISAALKQEFGESFCRINRSYLQRNDEQRVEMGMRNFTSQTKVLSGHLRYEDFAHLLNPDTKVITWLREPVDRVISHYHWNRQRMKDGKGDFDLEMDLIEFASTRAGSNWMSFMLEGLSLEDLYYVGFLESMEEDFARLARSQGWKNANVPHLNQGRERTKLDPASQEERSIIKAHNSQDLDLYQKARGTAFKLI